MTNAAADVLVWTDAPTGHPASTFVITPQSQPAIDWIAAHVEHEDYQKWPGGGVVVEHRYVATIVEGMQAEGLTVNFERRAATSDPSGGQR